MSLWNYRLVVHDRALVKRPSILVSPIPPGNDEAASRNKLSQICGICVAYLHLILHKQGNKRVTDWKVICCCSIVAGKMEVALPLHSTSKLAPIEFNQLWILLRNPLHVYSSTDKSLWGQNLYHMIHVTYILRMRLPNVSSM